MYTYTILKCVKNQNVQILGKNNPVNIFEIIQLYFYHTYEQM